MEQIEIKIQFFGELKKYFSEAIYLDVNKGVQASDVIDTLLAMNASAKSIIDISQLAIESTIVARDFIIDTNCELIILPPFSGG